MDHSFCKESSFSYVGSNISSSLYCSICQEPFIDPVETISCGHTYCRRCIYQWLDGNLSCPLDKTELKKSGLRPVNKIISSQLNDLNVCCKYCEKIFSRSQLEEHFTKICDNYPVRCDHRGCNEEIARKNANKHSEFECMYRPVKHHVCGRTFRACELPSHVSECTSVLTRSASEHSIGDDGLYYMANEDNTVNNPSFNRRNILGEKYIQNEEHTSGGSKCVFENSGKARQREADVYDAQKDSTALAHEISGVCFECYKGNFEDLPDFSSIECTHSGIINRIDLRELVRRGILQFGEDEQENERLPNAYGMNFAARFKSRLKIDISGMYTFYLDSNDGSKLFIDSHLVVENGGKHYRTERSGSVELSAGMHYLTVEYFHVSGKLLENWRTGPYLKVSYSCPGSYWPLGTAGVSKMQIPRNKLWVLSDKINQDDSKAQVTGDAQCSKRHQNPSKFSAMNHRAYEGVAQEEQVNQIRSLESELEIVKEMYFTSTALAIKLGNSRHGSRATAESSYHRPQRSITEMYFEAKEDNIPMQDWPRFIQSCLKS
eukprot:Nk52_evm5s252 gene=Nk52_evmTU5s252